MSEGTYTPENVPGETAPAKTEAPISIDFSGKKSKPSGLLPRTKTKPLANLQDYIVLIYGPSKIGKSTWCSHADHALFLATEPGLNALEAYQVPIHSWEDLLNVCREIATGAHDFKTIIIDTIDNAYKLCSEFVCRNHGIDHESDLPYGKGFAATNNEFYRVINKLGLMPYGLILVSHSVEREVETKTGKVFKIVPTLPDKARKNVLALVDMIFYCDVEEKIKEDGTRSVQRIVRTKPTTRYDAGDRTGRLPEVMPLDYQAFEKAFNQNQKKEND